MQGEMNMQEIEVHIEITNKCILQCKHCSSSANSVEKQLDLNKVLKFIEGISENKSIRLILTGGEPLLFPEVQGLLQAIKRLNRDIQVGMFTTGIIKKFDRLVSLSKREINELKNIGLKFVFLSLYSNNNKKHNRITNRNLSFERTIEAIEKFSSCGIETNINLPLMKSNIEELEEIIRYIRTMDVNEIRLLRLINHGAAKENWDEVGVNPLKQLDAIKSINLDDKTSLGGFLELKSCQYITDEKRCLAGNNKLYIDINGDIYPCGAAKCNVKTKLGSIHEDFEINKYKEVKLYCLACN